MIVEAGGFKLWTEDPIMLAVLRRLDEVTRERDVLVRIITAALVDAKPKRRGRK